MEKIFVLDSNILLTAPDILSRLEDNDIYIPWVVIEELDNHKRDLFDTGFFSRKVSNNVKDVIVEAIKKRETKDLSKGVLLKTGGKLVIDDFSKNKTLDARVKELIESKKNDNKILADILAIKEKAKDEKRQVILITNDTNLFIKANVLGIEVEDYHNNMVKTENLTKGYEVISVPKQFISKLKEKGIIYNAKLRKNLNENTFVILKSDEAQVLGIFKDNNIEYIKTDKVKYSFNLSVGKDIQKLAMYALTASADEIPLVILRGPAGCGKTFLSLAAGLGEVLNEKSRFEKLLVTRTNTLSDRDFGFLPGDIDDKMTPLLLPMFDNLATILSMGCEEREQVQIQINDFLETGILEMAPVAYMRGRSLQNTYLIVDEAQNATRKQILEIITRAGKGTKIVLLGDPDQIDEPKLSKENNGLVFASERFVGSKLCCQIEFSHKDAVRSPLSVEAAKRLTEN